jgi:two-component system, OmpR family, response regulator VicR
MARANILLADDEKSSVEIMVERLTKRDFNVVFAFSGQEVLERLDENSGLDVVILDVKMPGLDGIETLRLIKERHPLVEVVMLTDHATTRSAVEGMKLGAFDYLMKPCDIGHLVSKVEKAAARKRHHENKIMDARIKPYISQRDRNEMISKIQEAARKGRDE